MGSFGISREFEFKVGNHGEPCTKSCVAREEECFYREEKEVERIERVNRINKEPMASHWLSSCQGRRVFVSSSYWVCFLAGHESPVLTGFWGFPTVFN